MIRKEYKSLDDFTVEQLTAFRNEIVSAKNKEKLLEAIDKVLVDKVSEQTSLNSRFSIDWMNIDMQYLQLLHKNNIETLAQLREIEDLRDIPGITEHGLEQISWARDFFDMTPLENMTCNNENEQLAAAKIIVKHSKEVAKRHNKM